MRRLALTVIPLLLVACRDEPTAPNVTRSVHISAAADRSTGNTPNYNLEVLLMPIGSGDGFGHVKFRQAGNDNAEIVDLGVWVRDLAPNTEFLLQRATDTNLNGSCTGTNWLTLGLGPVAQSIATDDKGTGSQDLFRILTVPPGTTFDIVFQVVRKDNLNDIVLRSGCYQFSVK